MDPNKGCHSKKRYSTEISAMSKGRFVLATRGTRVRAYKCPLCLAWHLTKAGVTQPSNWSPR